MHELSIAQDLVALLEVEQLRAGPAARLVRATIEVGPLSGVDPRALLSVWPAAAAASTLPPDFRLTLSEPPLTIRCPVCGEQPAVAPQRLACARCDRLCADIVRGKELDLVEMEILDADADEHDTANPPSPHADPENQRHARP